MRKIDKIKRGLDWEIRLDRDMEKDMKISLIWRKDYKIQCIIFSVEAKSAKPCGK